MGRRIHRSAAGHAVHDASRSARHEDFGSSWPWQLAGFWKTKELPLKDEFGKLVSFCLDPGEFILALTHESVTVPRDMIALVEGRSTYARLGLSMHQTAPWIQPGWSGRIVLEIKNHGPTRVELTPLLDRPCQLVFFQLTSRLLENLAYGSRSGETYANQRHPLLHDKSAVRSEAAVSSPQGAKRPNKRRPQKTRQRSQKARRRKKAG